MRALLIILVTSSCAIEKIKVNRDIKPVKYSTKVKSCIKEMVGDFGAPIDQALNVCERLYKNVPSKFMRDRR